MKSVIFDWSGVIKDAFVSHLWVVNNIFNKYGVKSISYEELKKEWEEPYMLFFNKYLPDLTLEEEQKMYRNSVLDKKYPKSKAFPEIVEMVKRLKGIGTYLALISSDLPDSVFPEIKTYGLENVFDDVIVEIYDKTKIVQELINKSNLDLNNIFIVGDSNNEIAAGKKLGIKSIAVTWGFASEQKLRKLNPDFVVNNLKELEQIII